MTEPLQTSAAELPPPPALSQASRLLWLPILFVATLFLLAVVIRLCGQDPAHALRELWYGSFGSAGGLASTGARGTILVFYALGITLSFRAGILNIGAEGQSRVGAAAATALATGALGAMLASHSAFGMFVLLLAGACAGAAWSLIAGLLRYWRNVPEVIATLMLNYAGLQLVKYMVSSPAFLRGASILPQSDPLPPGLQFQNWHGTEFHSGAFLAIPVWIFFHLFLFSTLPGFGLRAMGLNPVAAKTCGIAVGKLGLLSFGVSGALAGFAGALGVMALGRLGYDPTFPDYGFMAIAVALVADLKPLYILPSAVLFAGLEVGAKSMQGSANVSYWVVYLVEGLVILAILVRGVQVFSKNGDGTR